MPDVVSQDAVSVIGGGVAGIWTALLLAEAGRRVTLHERDDAALPRGASAWAGGMLAPDCESEGADPVVTRLGRRSLRLWRDHVPDTQIEGSIVVAHPRERGELDRFARQTQNAETVGAERLAELEPALAGRFRSGLFFPNEGHVEPRAVLPRLRQLFADRGGVVEWGSDVAPDRLSGTVVDCRGLGARDASPALRGVKGETVLVETGEIALRRPVRLLHPRWPLYVIPRAHGRFLVGATSIESEDERGVSVRSALELLTAAYTIHPAFGEARIVELGHALRPAFPDHNPRVTVSGEGATGEVARGERLSVNGLYRHGYLLAPALAEIVTGYLIRGQRDNEVMRWT